MTTQTSNSPLPVNPPPIDLHRGSRRDLPPILNSPPNTLVLLFLHPQFLSSCKSQLTSPAHNLVTPLPIVSTRQFCHRDRIIWLFWGFDPGLQRWKLDIITLSCTNFHTWHIPTSLVQD